MALTPFHFPDVWGVIGQALCGSCAWPNPLSFLPALFFEISSIDLVIPF